MVDLGGTSMAMGIALGVAIGAAFHSIGKGLGIGVAIGRQGVNTSGNERGYTTE
jgi:hypothetical protein